MGFGEVAPPEASHDPDGWLPVAVAEVHASPGRGERFPTRLTAARLGSALFLGPQ